MTRTSKSNSAFVGLAFFLAISRLVGYPLDLAEESGIERLLGRQKLQSLGQGKLSSGALLSGERIELWMRGNPSYDLVAGPKDPALQRALEAMLKDRDPSYAIAVLDLTDPERPAYAGVREERLQLPGSVGKVLVTLGFFDALARAYPELSERRRILRETYVVADSLVLGDSHTVPFYDSSRGLNTSRPIRPGDRLRLIEWLDHSLSASANAAATLIWREAMYLQEFGSAYPLPPHIAKQRLDALSPSERSRRSLQVLERPLREVGLKPEALRQATMFTSVGARWVPGSASLASPKELVRLLLKLEQGKLVDPWSSLEIKRLLYTTTRRIRYAFSPELARAAVFFKSGSVYSCQKEVGFACGKFRGNSKNLMNSVAAIENPAGSKAARRYLVALMSNVLRKNSAWDHSRIGAAIDQAVATREAAEIREQGSEQDVVASGQNDEE